jgi:O-antigen/teichoic acid export membrane protein
VIGQQWRQTRLATWGGRGFWAVTDQGLFALSNFALNILLARWLVPEEYGAFAVAYTIFLLLGTVHTGILTEPMQVFGPGKHKEQFGHYLYVLVKGHMAFGLLGSFLFGLAALLLWHYANSPLAPVIGGLAFALPFILFQWLLRRACYVLMIPALAARAGLFYVALMLAGLFGLYHFDRIDSAAALIVMGIASLLSGLWLLKKLRVHQAPDNPVGLQRVAIQDHWRYGRWAMITGMLSWVPGNVVFLLLPVWHGLEATAVLRALTNLIMPALQINAALGMLLLPALVRAKRLGGNRMMQIVRNATLLFTIGAFLYWLLIGLFAEPAVVFLYGSNYTEHASMLWVLGVLPIITAWGITAGALLRAIERPGWVLRAYAIATVLTLTVGVALIWALGLTGALILLLLTSMVSGGLLWFYVSLDNNNRLKITSSSP